MTVPLRHPFNYAIAIPASLTMDVPHLREKTFRIGMVGRAAAIFRIDEIIVYRDMPTINQKADSKLIHTVLSYMETPQYLRKRLFKIMPELQYGGTLPPLRTPHHPTANKTKNLHVNEFREGVAISRTERDSLVDIGVEQPALVEGVALKPNTRVTVKITEVGKRPKAVLATPTEVTAYWGYKVTAADATLVQMIKQGHFNLAIATSKKGKPISTVLHELKEKWNNSHRTLVAFGAPTQGLYEISAHENFRLEDIADFIVNTIPNQGTETARTEEAVYATLSILSIL